MFVTKHTERYLLNMSHPEMDALRRVFAAGMLVLEGEDGDGLWSNYTKGERITIGRWQRRDPLELVTGPRAITRRRRRRQAALSSVA